MNDYEFRLESWNQICEAIYTIGKDHLTEYDSPIELILDILENFTEKEQRIEVRFEEPAKPELKTKKRKKGKK